MMMHIGQRDPGSVAELGQILENIAGWIIGYNENNFSATVAVFNTDPNGPTNDPTDPLGGSGRSTKGRKK
jgi:hypothetical protein